MAEAKAATGSGTGLPKPKSVTIPPAALPSESYSQGVVAEIQSLHCFNSKLVKNGRMR